MCTSHGSLRRGSSHRCALFSFALDPRENKFGGIICLTRERSAKTRSGVKRRRAAHSYLCPTTRRTRHSPFFPILFPPAASRSICSVSSVLSRANYSSATAADEKFCRCSATFTLGTGEAMMPLPRIAILRSFLFSPGAAPASSLLPSLLLAPSSVLPSIHPLERHPAEIPRRKVFCRR